MKENKIFNTKKIDDANRRIAFQIYESNINLKEIYLVGISSNGTVLSKRIGDYLNKISDLKVHQVELKIDKKNPRNKIDISINIQKLKNSTIVIIDDVLNSGSTLLYAVNAFLSISIDKIQTVVLVNRNHKKFPIKADFKGISLSTSVKEHIKVVLNSKIEEGVYLS
ncbi:MAG: phosphoribosyltransferase [Flavobacteriaceae bacterium]|nr:phosphoribosyltransferase [Flavobacteriaceae bacterium]MBQ22379.1 phosphoribosyltransferase [Flavobacteriales bacterium]|tara:strand:- start:650 stop:1150 length:501 start_codon:yes stop_codon:yes gene_type:complete